MLQRTILLLIFASSCPSLLAQQTSGKVDREKAGLIGPVATIKVESTYFKREHAKRVESERVARRRFSVSVFSVSV